MSNFSKKVNAKLENDIKNFIKNNFEVEEKEKQYAFWELKCADFSAVFYNSAKFLIQGKNIENLQNALAKEFPNDFSSDAPTSSNILEVPEIYIGTDESGKGDFFGPLVIAGVQINPKTTKLFTELGIRDSKTLKDEKMLEMAKIIQKESAWSCIAISNQKYNQLYSNFENLNKLLAWGHAKVIENILEKSPCSFALSDKFGDESYIKNALMKNGKKIQLEQRCKGESYLAVAAASVLARATYVQKMKDMKSYYGITFPKGCNDGVKATAKEFIKTFGKDRLQEVCKAHFKTFDEVL